MGGYYARMNQFFFHFLFQIVFELTDTENTRKLWEFKFTFVYTVKLTLNELTLNASVKNQSESDFDLTFCFHTYLKVPQISGASVKGQSFHLL